MSAHLEAVDKVPLEPAPVVVVVAARAVEHSLLEEADVLFPLFDTVAVHVLAYKGGNTAD